MTRNPGPSCSKVDQLNKLIRKNFVFPVSRKYGHLLSRDLPQSKITTTTTDKDNFKYLS